MEATTAMTVIPKITTTGIARAIHLTLVFRSDT